MKKAATIPFEFVLEQLFSLNPRTNPMFGCLAVYIGPKIVMALRDKDSHTDDNGIWISTKAEHHASLKKIFPSMRSIHVLGNGGATNWQILPAAADDFEESALKLCDLISKNDPRIGNIPKPKKKSVSKTKVRKKSP